VVDARGITTASDQCSAAAGSSTGQPTRVCSSTPTTCHFQVSA
jgi:hypothetical protein